MRFATAVCVQVLLLASHGQAAFTDFSDLTPSDTFQVGDSIQSNGVFFDVAPFLLTPTSPALVGGTPGGPTPPPFLSPRDLGLNFQIPPGTGEVSFIYSDGAGSDLRVNGSEPTFPPNTGRFFSLVDGMTIGGVSISTTVISQGFGMVGSENLLASEQGLLTLSGPISSIFLAGVELAVDDVTILVPEPATLILTLLGISALLSTRRRP